MCVCGILNIMIVFIAFQCRDTYWVESFNHQLLTYLPKRIHFGTTTFCMRMNLALCDWVSVHHLVCCFLSLNLNHHIAERELPARCHIQQNGAGHEASRQEDPHESARPQDFSFCRLHMVALYGEEPGGCEVRRLYVLLSHLTCL